MASWRSCRGPLIVTVAKSWGKIPTVHRIKILKMMSLPRCLSAPWHSRSQASGFSFMLSAQWPLLFSLWLDTFGLSASLAQARWASPAPSGLWSPVIVICAVGVWPNGQQVLSSSSELFSQLGLCMNQSRRVSLSQGSSSTWGWVWVSCFCPPLLCNSPATALASSPSCAPLMGGLGCLTFLTHP